MFYRTAPCLQDSLYYNIDTWSVATVGTFDSGRKPASAESGKLEVVSMAGAERFRSLVFFMLLRFLSKLRMMPSESLPPDDESSSSSMLSRDFLASSSSSSSHSKMSFCRQYLKTIFRRHRWSGKVSWSVRPWRAFQYLGVRLELARGKDKLQLTGRNLGRVFNFRSGHLHSECLWCYW